MSKFLINRYRFINDRYTEKVAQIHTVLPEHSDELWGEQLWPQCFDLSNISQKPQHVAVKLLFVWKLLE